MMFTNKEMDAGLTAATQLTREGRVLEATALIQRMLGQSPAPAGGANRHAPDGARGASNTIDVESSDITERACLGASARPGAAGDDTARRFSPESLAREGRRRDVLDVPPARTTRVDGPSGQFVSGFYANRAGSRPYKLYIPAGYAGQPLPLVVMLHGCTQTPDDFANGTRMNELADERQCFVLYPEQTHAANRSRCWNWFKRGDQRRDQGEPAILAGMTREIMLRHRIDPTRVYVAGLSAGGAMAAVMGAAYPELYAAVGIHSGLACASAHDLPSAFAAMRGVPAAMSGRTGDLAATAVGIPTIVFHGDRDKTVHPRNGEQVVSQSIRQNGASRVDASAEHGAVPGGHTYTRTVHRDSAGRVVVEHWLVHGGGHAWSGGSSGGSYTDPKGPDAAREMIRFFYQNGFERCS
jgi:poly(hydroxyalkanoate) depolymerase family esterase